MSLILVTGATGLVGSHATRNLLNQGLTVRALVRDRGTGAGLCSANGDRLQLVTGDVTDAGSLRRAVEGVTHIVHCAARVGDWGSLDGYHRVNVEGLQTLLAACRQAAPELKRFVHISSLGVYPARDHFGTDESEPPSTTGIDGYTRTKIESENIVTRAARENGFPAVVLRPGFVYGAGDRVVMPRLIDKLRGEAFAYLGSGEQLLNNIYAENLAAAIHLALFQDNVFGEVFNITDGRLVTRREFIETICQHLNLAVPTRHVPLGVAKGLANLLEPIWRLTGRSEPPVLSQARVKFLGLNLDFSIDKARLKLGYAPTIDFPEGIRRTLLP